MLDVMEEKFDRLLRKNIVKWIGLELALDQKNTTWEHPSFNYIQLFSIDVYFEDEERLTVVAGLDDGSQSFYRIKIEKNTEPIELSQNIPNGFLRAVNLNDFPVGEIDEVTPSYDKYNQCTCLKFTISGKSFEIIAGEVDWEDGSPYIPAPNEFLIVDTNSLALKP